MGANVNFIKHYLFGEPSSCPLHDAIWCTQTIDLLVKNSCNINIQVDGINTLMYAIQEYGLNVSIETPKFINTVECLLRHGINTDHTDRQGKSLVHYICNTLTLIKLNILKVNLI